jgi:hypothetical protein
MALLQGNQGQAGKQVGQNLTVGFGEFSDVLVSELQPRFYEQNYRNSMFSIGCTLTALSAATILLTASAQPIVGIWNPLTSPVNLVVIQATLKDLLNTLTTPASPGDFVWASSTGNTALTAGLSPFCRKTLQTNGSQARAFSLSTASLLTGLTNNLTVFEPGDFVSSNVVGGVTITGSASENAGTIGVQNIDGGLIVPPGGVLALLNTVSTTAHSVAARLKWLEVPV